MTRTSPTFRTAPGTNARAKNSTSRPDPVVRCATTGTTPKACLSASKTLDSRTRTRIAKVGSEVKNSRRTAPVISDQLGD